MAADALDLTMREAVSRMEKVWKIGSAAVVGGVPDQRGASYLGEGVLWCGRCEGAIEERIEDEGWYAASRFYRCSTPSCPPTSAPASEIAAELESLTRQYLAEPEVAAAWRADRLAQLDDRIALARTVLPWCCDQRRRRKLSRSLAIRERMTPGLRVLYLNKPRRELFHFGCALANLITERVMTAGASTQGRPIEQLRDAWLEWFDLYRSLDRLSRRQVRRALGGRTEVKRIDDQWERLQNRVLDLVQETDWVYTGPRTHLTDEKPLKEPWSETPEVMPRERQSLMTWALGARGRHVRLVVTLDVDSGARINVVPARD
ncbi:hypothetical protein GBF35_31625 [Nonomuraea phyllanthi]|uniref:hypothetical protein n=1 Tax=Nonomuraea phyllanthi TaxID=2219224 RepID=UPI001292FC4A|nr:hypothetical protein [Nonomuraea phyllanthi]QFY10556.1 hypothetical protein GBF35_31625 [Nonomuraea phyllanthi]